MTGADVVLKPDEPQHRRRKPWQTAVALLMTVAAVVWMALILRAGWPELLEAVSGMDARWLTLALTLCLVGAVSKGESFFLMLRQFSPGAVQRPQAYALQFIAQLVRHLPGRFWGVAYQITQTRGELAASRLVLTHAVLIVVAMYYTLWFVAMIFASDHEAGMLPIVLVFGSIILVVSVPVSRALARLVGGGIFPGRFGRLISHLSEAATHLSSPNMYRVYLVTFFGWLVYVLAWGAMGEAYPGLDFDSGLKLVALYSIAWVVGFVAIFTPSGLGVREVVFLSLAQSFPPDVLAATAVLGRAWLMFNDLLLGGIAMLVLRQRSPGEPERSPAFDDNGINVADPHDHLGLKADYITTLQRIALADIIGPGQGKALEVGCGFGRLSSLLPSLGYRSVAIDPSLRLVSAARGRAGGAMLCVGKLPNLPFSAAAFDLVLLINVLRPLHLMGIKDVVTALPETLAPGGRLVVLDNVRDRDSDYVPEQWIIDHFNNLGLVLSSRRAVRAGRWPGILAVRYGLVPRRCHEALARWELRRMSRVLTPPRWTYHNVVYVFERPA